MKKCTLCKTLKYTSDFHKGKSRCKQCRCKPVDRVAKFFKLVQMGVDIGDCMQWLGYKEPSGYGKASYGTKSGLWAHRISYEIQYGPIPRGLDLDHVCRNRACVNPMHLEPVTRATNLRRGRVDRCNET